MSSVSQRVSQLFRATALVGLTGFVAAAHAHAPVYVPPPVVSPASLVTAGSLGSLQVRDRDTGELLTMYRRDGRLYIAGVPGHRYSISMVNHLDTRGLFVVSVDGVNALTGETANFSQAGYVLQSGQQFDVNGWRKSRHEIATFTFTALPNSYAARTGRPYDVGTIGIALFRERPVMVAPAPYPHPHGPYEMQRDIPREMPRDMPRSGSSLPEAASRAPSAEPSWRGEAQRADKLGTGHGEREHSLVERTQFDRASARPDEVITIFYDSRENLIAQGVIPREYGYRHHYRGPRAFPGERFVDSRGFVPDPRY